MADPIATTTTAVMIHRAGQNPWIDEDVLELRMVDEAGGCFFELRQEDKGPIRADLEDLAALLKAARRMIAQPAAVRSMPETDATP